MTFPKKWGTCKMPSLPDIMTPEVAALARDAAAHARPTAIPTPDAGRDAFFEALLRLGDFDFDPRTPRLRVVRPLAGA